MEETLGIAAPIATMIAAMMTAANLGARITGWGFVVFTIGSLAWCAVAIASGQQNLLITNGFLVAVNIIGVWRWLGRVALHEDGARSAEIKSAHAPAPTLVAVNNIIGRKVKNSSGTMAGKVVGIMVECDQGKIAYLAVGVGGVGGVGQRLIAIDWANITIADNDIRTSLGTREIAAAADIDPKDWPVTAS